MNLCRLAFYFWSESELTPQAGMLDHHFAAANLFVLHPVLGCLPSFRAGEVETRPRSSANLNQERIGTSI